MSTLIVDCFSIVGYIARSPGTESSKGVWSNLFDRRCSRAPSFAEHFTEIIASPELSVVIATWNSWKFLTSCLPSILQQHSIQKEIVVVDNGSSDGTRDNLRQQYPSVRVFTNNTNEGHSRAVNKGIKLAQGKYVLILDADTVIAPGALEQLVGFMRSRPDVVIAAPKMLNENGTVQETARNFPKPMNALFGRETFLTRLFPRNRFAAHYVRRQNANEVDPYEVEWVSSACMIFQKRLSERIGLWDEGFRGYWVEADWCKQAHLAGKIYCIPNAQVTHFYQNRIGKKKGIRRIVEFHHGAHRFYSKNYTQGPFDPRSVIAGLALALRALPLIFVDLFRR